MNKTTLEEIKNLLTKIETHGNATYETIIRERDEFIINKQLLKDIVMELYERKMD